MHIYSGGPSAASVARELAAVLPGERVITGGPLLREVAADFGRVARGRPQVVVRARRTEDVRATLAVANRLGARVTPRGNGGNTEGQTVPHSGIVLDLRGLDRIDVRPASWRVTLGAGATWAAAVDRLRDHRLQVPVVPGYKGLTAGGTLAIGGGGYRSHTRGLQVDHVVALEVVTGAGEVRRVTPRDGGELFWAALGGGGLVAVITEATLALVPDERAEGLHLASYTVAFRDRDAFLHAALDPAVGEVFYEVQGNARPASRGWEYLIKGSVDVRAWPGASLRRRYPAARVRRRVHALLRSGRHGRLQTMAYDLGLRLIGRWHTPHPWATTFLPMEETARFFTEQLPQVDRRGLGPLGFVTLVPTLHHGRPYRLLQLPPGPRYGSFGIFYMPPDDGTAPALWRQLHRMQRAADAVGGKSYLADTLPQSADAWRGYYGEGLAGARRARAVYDPRRVLEPLNDAQGEALSV